MVNQLITGMIHAKQLLSFLAVSFIPAIIYCYGQERNSSAIVYLQKIELQDTTLKRVVSDIIKDYPNDFKQGHWYLMDYFSSGAGGSGFFMLDPFRTSSKLMGCIWLRQKDCQVNYLRKQTEEKESILFDIP